MATPSPLMPPMAHISVSAWASYKAMPLFAATASRLPSAEKRTAFGSPKPAALISMTWLASSVAPTRREPGRWNASATITNPLTPMADALLVRKRLRENVLRCGIAGSKANAEWALSRLDVIGHALNGGDGVDIADPDALADTEDDGGIVEDGAHAARDEQVRRLLRTLGG